MWERDGENDIRSDLKDKIVLLSGPRQVGKTTLARSIEPNHVYLNYDAVKDRKIIQAGQWDRQAGLVVFDELHKMKKWKSWIKGIYDTEGIKPGLLVTGSARLDLARRGGDSLAGRHFVHRLHPFTVRELRDRLPAAEALDRLLQTGGFPEPFIRGEATFAKRWRRHHLDTVLREDLLDLERIRDLRAIEALVQRLRERVGAATAYAPLAADLQVSIHTVRHWLEILEGLLVIFAVRPYHKNVARSLLKEPKYYFYDTGAVEAGEGARLENAVACGLLRELQTLEDRTGSRVALHYLRDREKREVDFLCVVDGKPRQLIEVKAAEDRFERAIFHFRRFLPGIECWQLVHRLDRPRSSDGVRMVSAAEFLAGFDLAGAGGGPPPTSEETPRTGPV